MNGSAIFLAFSITANIFMLSNIYIANNLFTLKTPYIIITQCYKQNKTSNKNKKYVIHLFFKNFK